MNCTKSHIPLIVIMTIVFANSAIAQLNFPSSIIVLKDDQTHLIKSESIEQLIKLKGINLKVYDIDAVDRFEAKLNKLLPADELKASQVLEEHIKRISRKTFEAEVIQAYQGIMVLVRHDLKKYPVIIFDDSSVIYGVTDLDEALLHYQNWRVAQESER